MIPWSPIARGFLAGNRPRVEGGLTTRAKTDTYGHGLYNREADYIIVDRVAKLSSRLGCNPAQIALAWMLDKPGITSPVLGASKIKHLEEAVAALNIKLSPEDAAYLEEPYKPHPVLGHS